MADTDGSNDGRHFAIDRPQVNPQSAMKGSAGYDFGMVHRLGRIFSPKDSRTVMLAFDHGYFQGPTRGLERIDLTVAPLSDRVDALMGTRGVIRSLIPAAEATAFVVRASGGASILKELSDERVAMSMEDALRMDASGVAVQVFIGGEHETQSVQNLTRLVDQGFRYGMPVIGVTAVGRELTRDARYLRLATRICAELGAQVVKTYYCEEDFETVISACPVPIVVAGGRKLPLADAFKMSYRAIAEGAAGLDMGRNIFQRANPPAMATAVSALVHQGVSAQDALEIYFDLSDGATD